MVTICFAVFFNSQCFQYIIRDKKESFLGNFNLSEFYFFD